MAEGGIAWVIAVNLIVWGGLSLYLLRFGRRVAAVAPPAAGRSGEE